MGHIVVSAPGIERFHLLERLTRELRMRSHRVTMLCLDATEDTFWRAQGFPTQLARPEHPIETDAPLPALAEDDCRRMHRAGHGRTHAAVCARLATLLPGLQRFLQDAKPDLVLLHQERSSANRLVHFLARQTGLPVVWLGQGLLPGTIQLDEEGLDGNSRAARRSAMDYRAVDSDDAFLHAALAGVLGHNQPPALARRVVQMPPVLERLRDACRALRTHGLRAAADALSAWRRALPALPEPRRRSDLPPSPFVAVLLQRDDDDRLTLDAEGAPTPTELVTAVQSAACTLGPNWHVVAVLPRGGLQKHELARLRRMRDLRIECADAALDTAAAAAAIVTVNDHNACTGLLAGTPVVHLGSAAYGVPGVAVRGQLATLPFDLRSALASHQPELQRRCLTWLLSHGHVWCSPEAPDHNGIAGLLLELERRIGDRGTNRARLHYRAGPAWPLAAESRP